jgi:hypothetical protein
MGATFREPVDLANDVADADLDAAVVDSGFGYTVTGVAPAGE